MDNTLFLPGSKKIIFEDSMNNAAAVSETRTYEFPIFSVAHPLSVTLVSRDPAGSTIQNSLHLRVIHKESGTVHTSEDINNIRNDVQKIVIRPPKAGLYHIEV